MLGLRCLLSLAVILPVVTADNLFAGCYTITPSGTTAVANQADAGACTTACTTGTVFTHSYYNATGRQCFCSNGTPSGQYLVQGNAGQCGSNYDNRNTRTSFIQWSPPCFDSLPAGLTRLNTNPTGLNSCLKSCVSYTMATFWRPPGTYACACGTPTGYGNAVTCGPDAYWEFYHTPAAAASGLTRRKAREELQRRARRAIMYCPAGLTACKVDFDDEADAYECIDTKNELESCGGCLTGQYGEYSGNATVGENCSDMKAAFGRATCDRGKCVASACERGYRLVEGRCVKSRK